MRLTRNGIFKILFYSFEQDGVVKNSISLMSDVGVSSIHNLHMDLFYNNNAFEANNLTPRHFVNWLFHHKPNLPKDKLWLWLTGQNLGQVYSSRSDNVHDM
jgi:hypothetical protein